LAQRKIEGKIFRASLGTDDFTKAKGLLPNFIKQKVETAAQPIKWEQPDPAFG
jgi:hypothetical protein